MTDAETLQGAVTAHFREHAPAYGLDASAVGAEYVLNPGGFVNHSFHVFDGRVAYHLKLATEPGARVALARWRELAPLLERHHAPPIVGWITLGAACEGALFPHIPGAKPALDAAVVSELMPALAELNADAALAERLHRNEVVTPRGAYLKSLHDRFVEDLRAIAGARPPFVAGDTLGWMAAEADRLADMVRASDAFAVPVNGPVHGDLWLENVLRDATGRWYLLDWDDVGIGDPAADVATLLGPTAAAPAPLKFLDAALPFLTADQQARLPLLGRATLLDWVIDPLADWIEADAAPPAHRDGARAEKERVHRAALAEYRRRYA